MWWDGTLSLCDQRDVHVFTTLDCNIPTARGLRVVTDDGTSVLVPNRLKGTKISCWSHNDNSPSPSVSRLVT